MENVKAKKSRVDKLYKEFERKFPDMAKNWKPGHMVGPSAICLNPLEDDMSKDTTMRPESLVWLYHNEADWHLGTKLYRYNPRVKKSVVNTDQNDKEKKDE